jgi:hypothetical protein
MTLATVDVLPDLPRWLTDVLQAVMGLGMITFALLVFVTPPLSKPLFRLSMAWSAAIGGAIAMWNVFTNESAKGLVVACLVVFFSALVASTITIKESMKRQGVTPEDLQRRWSDV